MEFILFVLIVVFWRVWTYPFIWVVQFLPSSFFVSDSTGEIGDAPAPKPVRKHYFDSAPDPFIKLDSTHVWRADQFMSAEAKAAYLLSDEWTWLRTEVLARDHFKCQVCGSIHNLAVHHITYINLGAEQLEDLITLCNFHHQEIHNQLGYDRTTTFDISTLKTSKYPQY